MERFPAAVVAACVLLVASLAATPVPAGPARSTDATTAELVPPSPSENTTARLVIPRYRITQSEFDVARIGMGTTLQSSTDRIRLYHDQVAIETAFENASTLDARRSVVDSGLVRLRSRTGELEKRERQAVRNYSDGNITATALIRRLVRIDAAAERIERSLEVMRDLRDRSDAPWFEGSIRAIESRAGALQGPVRRLAARAMVGRAEPVRIYVTAADEGVVLSALDGTSYLREAAYYRNRDPSAGNNVDAAKARAKELYPWAFENAGYNAVDGALAASNHRITALHPQGELVAYMDTGTADVYRENQVLSVTAMPTLDRVVTVENGIRVVLRRTYVGGPVDVLVEDATTDSTVNARVSVGGHDLGRSGVDGSVRTLEPRPPYDVSVTVGNATLNLTVERPLGTAG